MMSCGASTRRTRCSATACSLCQEAAGPTAWQAPLTVAPLVVRELLFAGSELPPSLETVTPPAPVMDSERAATRR